MTKILVFRNSNLGDYFISVPILRIIREKFPNCHITYMTIKNNPIISLSVLVEHGGKGSIEGTIISRKIFEFFLQNELIQ